MPATDFEQSQRYLSEFLDPLIPVLGRRERRVAATRYLQGLLLPGERKSIEPMAQRLGIDAQGLQQFVADSPWEEGLLWTEIRRRVLPALGVLEAWIVDETGWLKQGRDSVGVSHQYCGAVGKQANCQVCVEIAVSDGEIAAPAAGRLYLPEKWCQDAARRGKAGVPGEISFRTKPQIALDLLAQMSGEGVARAPVLGDAAYGDSSEFRAGLRRLGLEYFLQVSPTGHLAWDQPPQLIKKQKRRHAAPDQSAPRPLLALATEIADAQWQRVQWKAADGGTRQTRLAWQRVFLAHGLRHAGGEIEAAWLVVDWPENDPAPYHCYLAEFSGPPQPASCLRLSRSRWHIEQYFQRGKSDLGLDHYEGRGWRGFHHHLVLCALAYLFVLALQQREKKNFWPDVGSGPASDPAILAEVDRLLSLLRDKIRPGSRRYDITE
jgi:SRSO17 transposase